MECYHQLQANYYLKKSVELGVFDNLVKNLNDFWATNARLASAGLCRLAIVDLQRLSRGDKNAAQMPVMFP